MKTITIWQPWASLIMANAKPYEFRSWPAPRSLRGVLRPAVEAYLAGREMTADQIAAMRAYLRQWVDHGAWIGPAILGLSAAIDDLTSREAIRSWLMIAEEEGIDPL